jgi:biuret amidohydrolase
MSRDLALLVYDMQVGIAHRLPRAEPVIAAAQRALAAARAAKIPVFFCRHLTWPKAVSGPAHLRGGMALARAKDVETYVPQFLRESPGFPIIDELAPTADEGVFDKIGMSAFEGTPLETALRDLGVTTLAVVGAVLEIGIEPTVRHARELGFTPSVLGDACYTFLDAETARARSDGAWSSVDDFAKRASS